MLIFKVWRHQSLSSKVNYCKTDYKWWTTFTPNCTNSQLLTIIMNIKQPSNVKTTSVSREDFNGRCTPLRLIIFWGSKRGGRVNEERSFLLSYLGKPLDLWTLGRRRSPLSHRVPLVCKRSRKGAPVLLRLQTLTCPQSKIPNDVLIRYRKLARK